MFDRKGPYLSEMTRSTATMHWLGVVLFVKIHIGDLYNCDLYGLIKIFWTNYHFSRNPVVCV